MTQESSGPALPVLAAALVLLSSVSAIAQVNDPELEFVTLVPSASRTTGANDSFWSTDLEVNNGGTETATFKLVWLPADTDNSLATQSTAFTLVAGEVARFEDVISSVFGIDKGNGALAVISDRDYLFVFSRTYNLSDTGTFGSAVPGVAEDDIANASIRKRVLFFSEDDAYRTNLVFQNGTRDTVTVQWERFSGDGSMIDSGQTTLPPWGNTQINRVFGDQAPIESAYMDLWSESGRFLVFSSVVDNGSNDGTSVPPQINVQEPSPPPDIYSVCGQGLCSHNDAAANQCNTFMDLCLSEIGVTNRQCIIVAYSMCYEDDVPPDYQLCTAGECANDPSLQAQCNDFYDNCPLDNVDRCTAASFFICEGVFQP